MKALILSADAGEYDDYRWWITDVLLVPLDFDCAADYKAVCMQTVTELGLPLRKDGWPYTKHRKTLDAAYEQSLLDRFRRIPFEGGHTEDGATVS